MKKFALLILLGATLTTVAVAQRKTPKTPKAPSAKSITAPADINAAFDAKYAGISTKKWAIKNNGNYVASFTNSDSNKQEAEFDSKGSYVSSKTFYPVTNLPEKINAAISSKYGTSTVAEAVKLDIPGVSPYFRIKLKDGTTEKYVMMSEEGVVAE